MQEDGKVAVDDAGRGLLVSVLQNLSPPDLTQDLVDKLEGLDIWRAPVTDLCWEL